MSLRQNITVEVVLSLGPQDSLEQDDVLIVTSIDTPERLRVALSSAIPRPSVTAPASVEFSQVVADGRVNTRHVDITNTGSIAAEFNVSIGASICSFCLLHFHTKHCCSARRRKTGGQAVCRLSWTQRGHTASDN